MRRKVIPSVALFAAMACHLHRASSGTTEVGQNVRLSVSVELGESYASADFSFVVPDGGTVKIERVAFPDAGTGIALVEAANWSVGPGSYALLMELLRPDGGEAQSVARFDLTGREVLLSGTALFDAVTLVQLDLTDRTPPELRLEPTSEISREGAARYVLVNGTDRALVFDALSPTIEKWESSRWVPAWRGWGGCYPADKPAIHRGDLIALDVGADRCLAEALPDGRFRHVFRFGIDPFSARPWSADAGDHEVLIHRNVELIHEFEISSTRPRPRALVFPNVPLAEIRQSASSSDGESHILQLLAPDGGEACVCEGSLVGRERLQVVGGMDRLCLTSNPDASVVTCMRVNAGLNELGDHPPYGKPWDRGVPAPKP